MRLVEAENVPLRRRDAPALEVQDSHSQRVERDVGTALLHRARQSAPPWASIARSCACITSSSSAHAKWRE